MRSDGIRGMENGTILLTVHARMQGLHPASAYQDNDEEEFLKVMEGKKAGNTWTAAIRESTGHHRSAIWSCIIQQASGRSVQRKVRPYEGTGHHHIQLKGGNWYVSDITGRIREELCRVP